MKLLKTITDKEIGGTNDVPSANPYVKVRAVLLDENGYMALMYLPKYKHNDCNDLYMIPGGGVEASENLEKADRKSVV
jgi:ADP-ribose pyrophosphatase YjhB (NUDIX family)